jgi:glycine betaine/proline transport system permease protein
MVAIARPAVGSVTRDRLMHGRSAQAVAVLVAWIALYIPLHGHNTLSLAPSDLTSLHTRLNDLNSWVADNRNSNPVFLYFFNEIQIGITHLTSGAQNLISQPVGTRGVPYIGYLGVLGIIGLLAWTFGNWRVAVLAVAGFTFMGLQGLWQESMDTLVVVLLAIVLSLAVGIPLGVWAGVSKTVQQIVTPILDFMQTMPSFVYLPIATLVFLIGPATGVIVTAIYAMPPVVRLTMHGIREVPHETIEAADSLGSTRAQRLTKVLLPMSRSTIVVGVNQTTMAALSMATLAALVGTPGLGQTVLQALESLDVGTAFNAGLAIVIMAIVLDRTTTAASVRSENKRRRGVRPYDRYRLPAAAGGLVVTAVLVYLSYTYVWAAAFPTGINLGNPITNGVTHASNWVQSHLSGVTGTIKDQVTLHGLNPLQSLLDNSPFWLTAAAIIALAFIVGGTTALIYAALCLALIVATGLWQDAMDTLATTLVATVLVMILGVVVGVWMARNRHADRLVRPILDTLQVVPPFIYLVPMLALFAASRFTAIVAAVLYAAPVSIKIVADGIRRVNPATVEAARSAGSSDWQVITKVQLPMSLRTLVLATNQGLIYVLSMVVVGGLVGAGALGFDVVSGFAQLSLYGKGLAAGLAIVLLGIMLDRITQSAAGRADTTARSRRAT